MVDLQVDIFSYKKWFLYTFHLSACIYGSKETLGKGNYKSSAVSIQSSERYVKTSHLLMKIGFLCFIPSFFSHVSPFKRL